MMLEYVTFFKQRIMSQALRHGGEIIQRLLFFCRKRVGMTVFSDMTAYAYLRVSGRAQVVGDGFPRQEKAIRAYAAAQRIHVSRVFRDEGVSGAKDLENRPAWAALVEALHSNGVKLILVERLDRLARDLMIQESIIADIQRKGLQLVSVSEPDLCSNDPTRVLMRQMLGAFAQYEKAMIVSKLRVSRDRVRAKDGRCEGRKPFGYYPGEQRTLARLKELRDIGMAYDKIALTLNTEGMPSRSGGTWHAGVLHRILKAMKLE